MTTAKIMALSSGDKVQLFSPFLEMINPKKWPEGVWAKFTFERREGNIVWGDNKPYHIRSFDDGWRVRGKDAVPQTKS